MLLNNSSQFEFGYDQILATPCNHLCLFSYPDDSLHSCDHRLVSTKENGAHKYVTKSSTWIRQMLWCAVIAFGMLARLSFNWHSDFLKKMKVCQKVRKVATT